MRLAKINYMRKSFKTCLPKLTWKLVNDITGNDFENKDKIKAIKLNDSILNVDGNFEETLNLLNNIFIYVGKTL